MAIPVNVFNPNQFTIQVSVNNGNQVSIPGTSAGQNWQPQQPSQNPWSFGYNPAPNSFFPGNNQLMVSGAGGEPRMLMVYVSQQMQIFSLQLYLFLGEQSSWVLLNNGQVITSGAA